MKLLFNYVLPAIYCIISVAAPALAEHQVILNASYDPTREFYEDYNAIFAEHWFRTTGHTVDVKQSHGGSGKQARSVIDGLHADVVTLALAYDIDAIANKSGYINKDWQNEYPNNSAPYRSIIVILVRKGNPRNIRDWDDLTAEGIKVITPNPKTSGGARWNYLAAYAYALKASEGDEERAAQFMSKLFLNVSVLDSGARGSTTTFVQRRIGDALITWENEAYLAIKAFGSEAFEMVVPSISILAEPPVAVVDRNVDKHGSRRVCEEYLRYLYSDEAQRLVVKHNFRPVNDSGGTETSGRSTQLELVDINGYFGGWERVHKMHFAEGGLFDRIYQVE